MQKASGPDLKASTDSLAIGEPVEPEVQDLGVNADSNLQIESGYQELRSGAALVDSRDRSILTVRGADRVRFFNGMVTGDIDGLKPGDGLYCFLTTARGRILSDVVVLAQSDADEQLTLLVPYDMAESVRDHLQKYIVADRVELELDTTHVSIRLIGPDSAQCLGSRLSGQDLPDHPWGHRSLHLGDVVVRVVAENLGDVPGFRVLVKSSDSEGLIRYLLDPSLGQPFAPCESQELDVVRIEEGVLLFGKDFGTDNFPKETGIEAAVSYSKGCYLGQEVVARIHYRGQVNNVARGLVLGRDDVQEGADLQADGRSVGSITSTRFSPKLNRTIGISIMHRSAAAVGRELSIAGGALAEVVSLPFGNSLAD